MNKKHCIHGKLLLLIIGVLLFFPGCPIEEVKTTSYVAGFTRNSQDLPVPCYWKNEARTDLDVWPNHGGKAESIVVVGTHVYIAGSNYSDALKATVPCLWEDEACTELSVIPTTYYTERLSGEAFSIWVEGTHTYIAGYSNDSNDWMVPALWTDGVRTDLSKVHSLGHGVATGVQCVNGNVVVAGWTQTNTKIYVPCYWQNGVRTDLNILGPCQNGIAEGVFLSGNNIHFAGYTWNNPLQVPCTWNNGIQSNLGGAANQRGYAKGIFVLSDDVFAAGYAYKTNPYVEFPCFWKNGIRTDLPAIDASYAAEALAIYIDLSNVDVAGFCYNTSHVRVPCIWGNGLRTDLSVLDTTKFGEAHSIFIVRTI